MSKGDLDISLLHSIMTRLGELRERSLSQWNPVSEGEFMDLMIGSTGQAALNQLQQHTEYLRGKGLLKIPRFAGVYRVLELTDKGQTYVQPELADFGDGQMLSAVVKGLEDKIAVLSYPEPEKTGMLHRMREALAEKAPDLLVKVLVELGAKIAAGHG